MKNLFLTILLCSFCVCISCDKQEAADISPDGLTQCKDGYECLYTFTHNSRIDSNRVKPGNYTVFNYEQKDNDSPVTLSLNIDPRTNDTDFSLGKKQIENGQLAFYYGCPVCNTIGMKPVDGFIKGKKRNGTTWLLDMQIVLAEINTGAILDTLKLKQYFNLKKSN